MASVWRLQCAFSRLFNTKYCQILNNATDFTTKQHLESLSLVSSCRYSSYAKSPFARRIKEEYNYEIVKDSPDWKYVTRLLPFKTIPEIKPKATYPSGWIPPKEESKNLPYFIPRTKNGELPIYLQITHRGQRKISKIKKIEGDLWLLNDTIKDALKSKYKKYIETRVHELARFIDVKGDYVNDIKKIAYSKGF